MIIVTVALHRDAAGLANGMPQRLDGLFLGRLGAGHVKDFFPHDRAVQIIDAIGERDLREGQAEADPIGGEVVDVIEINAADREIAQLLEGGRARDMGKNRALSGSKAKGMKPVKPPVSSCSSRNWRR